MCLSMEGFILATLLSLIISGQGADVEPEIELEDSVSTNSSYLRIDKKSPLQVILQWKQIIYDYPNLEEEKSDIKKGIYIPGRPFPVDVDVSYSSGGRKIFVVTSRVIPGVPVSLSTVSPRESHGNPILVPYPSWSWHKISRKCSNKNLISVTKIEVDNCDRLWVLDSGFVAGNQTCPPKILVFSLKTDKVVYQYEIPDENYFDTSLFAELVVDIRDKCESPYVYLADAGTNAIVVLNVKTNTSWRIQDKTMYPSAEYADISVNGVSFESMVGIIAMAITPYSSDTDDDREIYFHPLNAGTETIVSTTFLRNSALFDEEKCAPILMMYPEEFDTIPKRRYTQSGYQGIDKDGVLLFGLIEECALACYNTNGHTKYYEKILTDTELLDYIFGLKIIDKANGGDQEVWIISNRYERTVTCSMNPHEINFRILVGDIADLIAGKRCRPKKPIFS